MKKLIVMLDNVKVWCQPVNCHEQLQSRSWNNEVQYHCAKISLTICTCKYMVGEIERWRICFKINNRSYDHLLKLKLKFIITPPDYKINVYENYEIQKSDDVINEIIFDNLGALALKIIYMDVESPSVCKYLLSEVIESETCTSNLAMRLLSHDMPACYQAL